MAKDDDIRIIEEIKKGNDKAFSELFDAYYNVLCFFSNKYVSDLDLSRSVVQQFFVDLWINREKISINQSVKSYLFTSVRNASIDYLRKNKERPEKVQEIAKLQVPFRDLVEEAELKERISMAINDLPHKCREIFITCRFDGLKYAEIAVKYNISVKTVEMQMGIALKRLRQSLSDYQIVQILLMILLKNRESVTG